VRTRATALATEQAVEDAARRELQRSESAVAAVVAGFFVAAGIHADVLLGPMTLLIAGVGSGGRVFDGRLRQPGLEAKRPRGLLAGEAVPAAARVALPTTVPALSVALAYDRGATLTALARLGSDAARGVEAESRARVLERIAEVGTAALTDTTFMRPLLHVASPSEGGLLSPADFAAASDVSVPAAERHVEGSLWLEPPWAEADAPTNAIALTEAVCAVDAQGAFAALSYSRIGSGLRVDALELVAPLAATPVERGRPRVRPGERIPARAPLAVVCDATGAPREVRVMQHPAKADARPLRITRDASRWLNATR
jgi:hypothetical protein